MSGTLRVIDNIEEFLGVARGWDKCLMSMPEPSMFVCSGWLIAWWRVWSPNLRMHVVVVESDGEILGGAAVCSGETTYYGVQVREFKFIGDPASDRQEFIVKPLHEDALLAIWSHFRSMSSEYDLVRLEEVPLFSATVSSARLGGVEIESEPSSVLPYLSNLGNWEEFERELAPKFRSEMRTREKLFNTWGRWSFGVVEGPAVGRYVDEIAKLELESARGAKGKALFSDPRNVKMVQNVVASSDTEIIPVLSILRLEERIIAHALGFKFRGRYHGYNTASLPEYGKGSPGKWVIHKTIRHATETGLTEFDFLRGANYVKSKWRPQERMNCRIALFGRSRRAWMLRRLVFGARPLMKRIYSRARAR